MRINDRRVKEVYANILTENFYLGKWSRVTLPNLNLLAPELFF